MVRYLVEQCGADVHANETIFVRMSALEWASACGHLEVVKYLVENGADVHACDGWALREASWNRHLEVVEYLKSKGAFFATQ